MNELRAWMNDLMKEGRHEPMDAWHEWINGCVMIERLKPLIIHSNDMKFEMNEWTWSEWMQLMNEWMNGTAWNEWIDVQGCMNEMSEIH